MANKKQKIQELIGKLYNAIQDKTNEIYDSNYEITKLYQNHSKESSYPKEIDLPGLMFLKSKNGYIIEYSNNSILFYKENNNKPIYSVNIYKTDKKYTGWIDIDGKYYDFNNQSDHNFIENKVNKIITILNNQDFKIDEEKIKDILKTKGKVPSTESRIEQKLKNYILSLLGYELRNNELLDNTGTKIYHYTINKTKTNKNTLLEKYTIKSDILEAIYTIDYYQNKMTLTLETNSNIKCGMYKSITMEKGIISNKKGIIVRLNPITSNEDYKNKVLFAIQNDRIKISSTTKSGRTKTITVSENSLSINNSSENNIDSLNISLDENGYKVTIPNKNINEYYSKDNNLFRELLLHPKIKNYILSILDLLNKELKAYNNLDGILEIIYKTFPKFKNLLDEEYKDNQIINTIIELTLGDKKFDYTEIKKRVDDIVSRNTSSISRELVLNKITEEVENSNLDDNIKEELIIYIENSKQNLKNNLTRKRKKK